MYTIININDKPYDDFSFKKKIKCSGYSHLFQIFENEFDEFLIEIDLLNIQIFGNKYSKEWKKIKKLMDDRESDLLKKYIFDIMNERLNIFEIIMNIKNEWINSGKQLKQQEIQKVLGLN